MDGSTVRTSYWHRTGDGRVQCDVCPRACRLHEGQRGFCFVRMRQDDAIVREAGVRTVAVTAGYVCAQPRADFFRHIDAANVDLKGFTGDFYRKTCLADLDPMPLSLS
jgi:hypothetical protein